jgi:hypothetical protein
MDNWRVLVTDGDGNNPTAWEGEAPDGDTARALALGAIELPGERVADVWNVSGGDGR